MKRMIRASMDAAVPIVKSRNGSFVFELRYQSSDPRFSGTKVSSYNDAEKYGISVMTDYDPNTKRYYGSRIAIDPLPKYNVDFHPYLSLEEAERYAKVIREAVDFTRNLSVTTDQVKEAANQTRIS